MRNLVSEVENAFEGQNSVRDVWRYKVKREGERDLVQSYNVVQLVPHTNAYNVRMIIWLGVTCEEKERKRR